MDSLDCTPLLVDLMLSSTSPLLSPSNSVSNSVKLVKSQSQKQVRVQAHSQVPGVSDDVRDDESVLSAANSPRPTAAQASASTRAVLFPDLISKTTALIHALRSTVRVYTIEGIEGVLCESFTHFSHLTHFTHI